MRVRRSVSILFLVFALSLAVVLTQSAVQANDPASSKSHDMAATSPSQPDQAHLLYAALWRTDGSFVSTIRIKNVLVVAPLQVTPTLFMADGTAYPLPSVTIPISGVATININDALAATPQSIAPHISQFGSATLFYTYPSPGHLLASIAAIDVPRSLSFVYPVLEPMPMPSDTSMQTLEGLWWKHDPGVRGTISLSNTTDQQRIVTLREVRNASDQSAREVQLAPHSIQMIDLEQISRDASDSLKTAGGVRVEFQGPRESIMITGSLANETIGYSANMPFWSRGMMTSTGMTAPASPSRLSLGMAGLMVGKPDAMMMPGFPADTKFAPYLALRNTTAKPIDVALQLNYMPMMEGATPVNQPLPVQRLHPFQAKLVDLDSMIEAAGLPTFSGTINLDVSFTGEGGDLVVASGSVDQTGSYVFGVLPQWVEPSIGRTTGYWSIAKGNDAMFSLWNPSNAPQDLTATIYYGDGSGAYHLPVHLAPQASTMIDIGMLIMNRVPGADGKIIPPGIEEGSVSFDSTGTDLTTPDHRVRMTIVISGGLFNVATATCGETCTYCNGYSNFSLSPGSASLVVGGSLTFTAWGVDSYGNPNEFFGGQWSTSSNGTVSSVSGGTVTGDNGGGDAVMDQLSNIQEWQGQMCVSDNMTPNCNPQNPYASASVSVVTATISQKTSSTVSTDDSALTAFQNATGNTNLGAKIFAGNVQGCGIGFETIGTITPSNYTGNVTLHRTLLNQKLYVNSTDAGGERGPNVDDTSPSNFLDVNPQSGGSAGKVYDLDGPSLAPASFDGNVYRYRTNFSADATLSDGSIASPSPGYFFYVRFSCQLVGPGYVFVNDVPGDNQIGLGSTPTTWNLQ